MSLVVRLPKCKVHWTSKRLSDDSTLRKAMKSVCGLHELHVRLGWSSEGNYNDLFAYDLENRDWFVNTLTLQH